MQQFFASNEDILKAQLLLYSWKKLLCHFSYNVVSFRTAGAMHVTKLTAYNKFIEAKLMRSYRIAVSLLQLNT